MSALQYASTHESIQYRFYLGDLISYHAVKVIAVVCHSHHYCAKLGASSSHDRVMFSRHAAHKIGYEVECSANIGGHASRWTEYPVRLRYQRASEKLSKEYAGGHQAVTGTAVFVVVC